MTQDMMTRNGYKDLWNNASTKLRNGDSLRREKVKCVQESLLVRRERTFSPSGANSQYVGDVLRFLRCAVCVMMMLMGVNVWGEDYSGVYYIKNNNNNTFYLCTSTVFYDGNHYANSGEMPYLTTATNTTIATDWDKDAVWRIIKSGDYYYVVHAVDGKYLTLNDDPTNFTNNNRCTKKNDEFTKPNS